VEHQAERFGLSFEDLLADEDLTVEQFRERARQQAEQTVKAQLVLDALASQLELPLEAEDLDREIVRHAQANRVSPQQILEVLQQQGTLSALVGDVMRRKTIDAIVAAAEVEGAPSDDVLRELGLLPPDPVEDAEAAEPTEDAAGEPAQR
jgi:trigger factor